MLAEPVRMGHKIALVEIAPGQPIVKYGQIIGFASRPIAPGQWVHTHNVDAGAFVAIMPNRLRYRRIRNRSPGSRFRVIAEPTVASARGITWRSFPV